MSIGGEFSQASWTGPVSIGTGTRVVSDAGPPALPQTLVERVVDVFDVSAAAMLLGDGPRLAACSDERVRRLGRLELEMDDGPGLASWRGGRPVVVDTGGSVPGRWPRFARAAQAAGFAAVYVLPMRHGDLTVGALSLYCSEGEAFGPAGAAAAQAVADVATIGVLHERALSEAQALCRQLQAALDSRVVIEQAKGLLAGRAGIGISAAFQALRSYARNHNAPLSEVSRQVVDGRLPVEALVACGPGGW